MPHYWGKYSVEISPIYPLVSLGGALIGTLYVGMRKLLIIIAVLTLEPCKS